MKSFRPNTCADVSSKAMRPKNCDSDTELANRPTRNLKLLLKKCSTSRFDMVTMADELPELSFRNVMIEYTLVRSGKAELRFKSMRCR